MNALQFSTPCYVLLDGKQRVGPKLLAPHAAGNSKVIYGFSDKQPYDLFCTNTPAALTPYPLVKGYLKSQIIDSGGAMPLVVLDAEGPDAPLLYAATMESVLIAQQTGERQVRVAFQLKREPQSQSYRIENALHAPDATNREALIDSGSN